MKKHIKKRLLFEFKMDDETKKLIQKSGQGVPVGEAPRLTKMKKNQTAFVVTDTDTVFQTFPFKYQGQIRFVPEPDPVLVYFHSAYMNYRQIEGKKKIILKNLLEPMHGEPMVNELYEFFGLSSGFVIFLFTAMEAFLNSRIPDNYTFTRPTAKRTETYNKQQIEE